MPTFSKAVTTITYSEKDIRDLIMFDLKEEGYLVTSDQIEIQISGGYVDCDCNSWGGPRVGDCHCPFIPPKFEGYRIIYKD